MHLIVYYTVGGNTKIAVKHIESKLNEYEQEYKVLALPMTREVNIESFSHIFIGSPTYNDGKTPTSMLDFLKYILKENHFKLPSFSVFGTGDTQWRHYCRAVDEISYHLRKKTKVVQTLKLEQCPVSQKQIQQIYSFVEQSLGGHKCLN
jgi:flavodoxin I